LVLLVLKHISLAIACRETETKVALRADAFLFLVSTSKHGGFPSAHLSQKIIATLVSALDALLPTAIQLTLPAIYRGIGTSMAYLLMGPGREAVEAEFLRFIVSCAVKYARGPQIEGAKIYEEIGWIMKTIFAQSLVSCSEVTAIHSALKEVQSSPEMEEFAQVPFFSVWITLATLVEQRARVLNSWKSAGSHWLAACNNMTVDHSCLSSVLTNSTNSVERSRHGEVQSAVHIAQALITAPPTATRQIRAQVTGKFANLQNNIA
jgi:hypothetical protein